jgi:hypothetical protein
MANLQHLHCWSFLLIHAFSLPPLAYKRRPGHPIPSHTSSQAIFLSFSTPTVQRNSIHSACQFCPAATPPVHSLVPDDLAIEMLPIFSSRCSHMSPTSYPKITPRGVLMQQGHHPPWLLPVVYAHPESIRQAWSQHHQELDRRATCSYVTFPCSSPVISK